MHDLVPHDDVGRPNFCPTGAFQFGQQAVTDGVVVDSENGLQDAIAAALKTGNTTVIGVRIDGSGYVDQFNALREL